MTWYPRSPGSRPHTPGAIRLNALLEKLGIDLPIIQAPMAGVSTPEMAAAVSNAGGLGSIGVGPVGRRDRPRDDRRRPGRDRSPVQRQRVLQPTRRRGSTPGGGVARSARPRVRPVRREAAGAIDGDLHELRRGRREARGAPGGTAQRSSASTSACPPASGSRPSATPGSCCSPRPRISTRGRPSPPPGSTRSSPRGTRRADTAACSTPRRRTIGSGRSP